MPRISLFFNWQKKWFEAIFGPSAAQQVPELRLNIRYLNQSSKHNTFVKFGIYIFNLPAKLGTKSIWTKLMSNARMGVK